MSDKNEYGRFMGYDSECMFENDGLLSLELQPLVYDFSTGMMKLGFSGDDAPRAVFPSIIGRPKNPNILVGMDAKDCFVGDEAQAKRGILNLSSPMPTDRTDVNFEDLERLIHHCPYNELCVTPEEHPLMFTPFYNMTFTMYNKISEMLFEVFNHPALYCCDDTVLSLICTGRETGCCVELGHGGITSTCIYGLSPINHSKVVLEEDQLPKPPRPRIGGELVTNVLTDLLVQSEQFPANPTMAEREIIRDIKEKLCFVQPSKHFVPDLNLLGEKNKKERIMDGDQEKLSLYTHRYELPDGTFVTFGKERFYAPEILFQPNLVGYNLPGVHELIKTSIEQIDSDLHQEMYKNTVVAGGTSMFDGFTERLQNELSEIIPTETTTTVKVHACAERKFSVWIGGSLISSLSTFRKSWVTNRELKELGNYRIMKTRCQMCTLRNDGQIGLLKRLIVFDQDLVERVQYVCDDERGESFEVKIRNLYDSVTIIKVCFKSLLLL